MILFWLIIRLGDLWRVPRRDCEVMSFGRGFFITRGEISRWIGDWDGSESVEHELSRVYFRFAG